MGAQQSTLTSSVPSNPVSSAPPAAAACPLGYGKEATDKKPVDSSKACPLGYGKDSSPKEEKKECVSCKVENTTAPVAESACPVKRKNGTSPESNLPECPVKTKPGVYKNPNVYNVPLPYFIVLLPSPFLNLRLGL